jgi:hypothetical protein
MIEDLELDGGVVDAWGLLHNDQRRFITLSGILAVAPA